MTAAGTKRGYFIVIEGPDGIGKSSQARKLGDALLACGKDAFVTREPGGTPTADSIRSMLLDPLNAYDPRTEVLLHFAARADHVHRLIFPAIAAGKWVICDRYWFSTMIYQGIGLGIPLVLMDPLCEMVGLAPDLTIFLDTVDEAELARRCAGRSALSDRYEGMDAAFQSKIVEGYRKIAHLYADDNCVMVDATGSKAEVHDRVVGAVERNLGVRINA
jgi:dTMP kinase